MTNLPVHPCFPGKRPDQPFTLAAFLRSKWVLALLALPLLLSWRYGIARDVLIVNRYPQEVTVRVAGVPCDSAAPAKNHHFALLPLCFSRQDTTIIVYGADGKLLKSQTVDLTREQNHYDRRLVLDVKP